MAMTRYDYTAFDAELLGLIQHSEARQKLFEALTLTPQEDR